MVVGRIKYEQVRRPLKYGDISSANIPLHNIFNNYCWSKDLLISNFSKIYLKLVAFWLFLQNIGILGNFMTSYDKVLTESMIFLKLGPF